MGQKLYHFFIRKKKGRQVNVMRSFDIVSYESQSEMSYENDVLRSNVAQFTVKMMMLFMCWCVLSA